MTDQPSTTNPSRREFLRAAGRWLAGGLLAGATAWLLRRGGRECDFAGACGICPQLARCDDGRATTTRDEIAKDRAWTKSAKS